MALVCDVCKTRPATARVAFMVEGQQRVVDVCAEDFTKLQAGNSNAFQALAVNAGFDSYTKQFVKRAADVAAEFGQREISSEHLLVALTADKNSLPLWEALRVNPEDISGFISMNTIHDARHTDSVQLSDDTRYILRDAHQIAEQSEESPGPEHLLAALIHDEGMAGTVLRRFGITEEAIQEVIEETEEDENPGTATLEKYSRDLTKLAKKGKLDPVIGREPEIETVIEVLSRRTKNNPVLIGEPGVGKTAVVEGLAQRVHEGNVPAGLKGKRLLELSLSSMVAGSKFRGEFEERIQGAINEIRANQDKLLVFIDELHTVVGAGSGEGSLDAANIIKPALARGELHMIGATTLSEYRKHIEKDAALERRFQPVMVGEPSLEDSIAIIEGLKPKYEEHHRVKIAEGAVKAAVELSDRYLTQRFLPDKAIDLIDQASSRVRIQGGEEVDLVVTDAHVAEVLARLTGIPVSEVTQEEKERLIKLEDRLHERVIGQDAAVKSVANAIRISRAGLTERHAPIATFLFLGPTGVGKTELAKALAADMFGSENALTRIDMSEYMERHAVARLIGSPPGYVGFEEGGQLTEAVRRRPYSVILLDEIEKAHPDVANVLLQLFDDGRLTDGKGRTVDFSNAIIIATSNLGSEMQRQAKIGFQPADATEDLKQEVIERLSQHFRPEFINRIDEIISFHPLSEEDIRKVVTIQLERLKKTVAAQGVSLGWTPALVDHFAETGFDIRFGARELKRRIKSELEKELASALLEGRLGKKAKADFRGGAVLLK